MKERLVMVQLKIFPENNEVNLEKLKRDITSVLPQTMNIKKIVEEDLAYGYKVLKAFITMPEETEGGTTKLEEIISSVSGVTQVDVELVWRYEF
ncbi:MAG: elongation factor 1-beta [Candidatus Methanomethylicia archaeon]